MKGIRAVRYIIPAIAAAALALSLPTGVHALGQHTEKLPEGTGAAQRIVPVIAVTVTEQNQTTARSIAEPAPAEVSPKPTETAVKDTVQIRNFYNVAELQRWLENRKDVVTIYFRYPDGEIDCDDYAIVLQRSAIEDGFILSLQIIEAAKYNALFRGALPPEALHAINLALIGNEAYYIEPQTGEVVLAAHID